MYHELGFQTSCVDIDHSLLKFDKLTKEKEKEWDLFVDSSKNGRFENKTTFINFLFENKKNPENFFIEKNKKVIGIITLTKNKIGPFTRYASQGIILKNKNNKNKIIRYLGKHLSGATYLRLNNFNIIPPQNKIIPVTFILNIKNKSLDEILKKEIHKSATRSIKNSIKHNLSIKITNSQEELKKFYPIYKKKMKEFKIIPYTLNSLKNLIKNKNYKLFNVYYENKLIAGGTMILHKKLITNHLAASNKKFLNLSPNNFLYYQLIKYAINNNFHLIEYGPSLRKDKIAKFKKSMGGKPATIEEHIILKKIPYFFFKYISLIILKLKKII